MSSITTSPEALTTPITGHYVTTPAPRDGVVGSYISGHASRSSAGTYTGRTTHLDVVGSYVAVEKAQPRSASVSVRYTSTGSIRLPRAA
ncbi:hypothetical protein [Frondihabitans sp. Leaf304]|uniref:hypothetical protein n=1 Tax=Frondihabitans sp. Leaf304 TaxID=1736329 RepID=UPI0006F590D5|nr:hypothetical protein [Frondihabitans sp. Leaf304]KQQ28438.1 hypothetical protein ASF54_07100 [Frondihabitans sp. Leaf304]